MDMIGAVSNYEQAIDFICETDAIANLCVVAAEYMCPGRKNGQLHTQNHGYVRSLKP